MGMYHKIPYLSKLEYFVNGSHFHPSLIIGGKALHLEAPLR